ncbi:MAG: DUF1572 family protein [Bacteroidota bacterium]|nr:DUF1572 family protein [Bacteroidota bacterium]MDE2834753.1 DUF1572 family protein [Bacteroidota bacterium]MDE2956893.1 DUF1572 family protein [Bacteroidota bacterium]
MTRPIPTAFIGQSRKHLLRDYWPKICRCIETLEDGDLWWRPNAASNSPGNLLLHLAGNVRQWIIAGVGQGPDIRQRRTEFEAQSGLQSHQLLGRLHETLMEADAVLAALSPADLMAPRTIQGIEVTVLEAVYHVVEHFSTHVGQLIYITKLRTGRDLRFYAMNADGTVRRGWLSE